MELPFVTAMTIGFLGSTHCVGMCGGIVGALNAPSEQSERRKGWASALHHISYNGGRIVSYVIAGALGGLIGAQVGRIPLATAVPVGGVVAAMVMVALGFYIGGWWRAIADLETLGQFIWRKIQPLGQRFLPVRNSKHAFGLGLVWGWLPCGLVYSALTLAVVSGAPGPGAAIMFGFGLGYVTDVVGDGRCSSASKSSHATRHNPPGCRCVGYLFRHLYRLRCRNRIASRTCGEPRRQRAGGKAFQLGNCTISCVRRNMLDAKPQA